MDRAFLFGGPRDGAVIDVGESPKQIVIEWKVSLGSTVVVEQHAYFRDQPLDGGCGGNRVHRYVHQELIHAKDVLDRSDGD
jgi:hypothetical protein